MRFRTKFGGVLAATALLAMGFGPQASAWRYSMAEKSTLVTDVSICAATSTTPAKIVLKADSVYLGSAFPGYSVGTTDTVIETVYADAALSAKIADIAILQTVTGKDASDNWILVGQGSVSLAPTALTAGGTVYVGEYTGSVTPKAPVALQVNAAKYGCPTDGGGGSISVPVPTQTLGNKLTTVSRPSSAPIPASVAAGSYTVVQGSRDDAHPLQEDQTNERWFAVFYDGAGNVVGTTATTPDLPRADVTGEWSGGTITLTANATSVVYFHAPGGEGPDSVYPNLLRLTPTGNYPPTPKPEDPKPEDPKPDAPKPDAPKPDAPKPDAPKPVVESEAVAVAPIVAVAPANAGASSPIASAAPTSSPAASTATAVTAAPTTTPQVEVKGIQVANVAPAAAPVETAEVAFTGSESLTMIALSAVLIALGSLALSVANRRRRVAS